MTQISQLTDAVQPTTGDLFTLQRQGRLYKVSWESILAAIGTVAAPITGAYVADGYVESGYFL